MGGIISPTKEEEIMKLLRLDESKKLQDFINDNQLAPNILYTKHKRTLLQLCCYYDSVNCLSKLIEMKYDYNQIEKSNGNSPLFICCKFNCLDLVQILLSKDDCKKLVKNNDNLNEFDIAFLRGNYPIC
jgi:ankyrin repeat protein